MKIISVVGARPQFIKLAPVSAALRAEHDERIIHTGQHYDERMSAVFFDEMGIPEPDYHLGVGSGSHGEQTGQMLIGIEEVLQDERPDCVIVFGDTNSTLAGALAAAKLHIPVVHIEAGLRSFNRRMPEEINRVLTDHLASVLFCPTEAARLHLEREGITRGVRVVGDVMYDVAQRMEPRLAEHARTLLPLYDVRPKAFILLTTHRPSNTDDPAAMARIARAISALDEPVVFPVHPRTRRSLGGYDLTWGAQARLVEPVGHLAMLTLISAARMVVTDSGGVQKEAFLLGTPCVTLRDETEWPETLEGGWNTLVGNQPDALRAAAQRPTPPPLSVNPFGDGEAATAIALALRSWSPE